MTEPSVSIYITDLEAFLQGDRDYSMSIYRTDYFNENSIPDHWVRLQVVPLNKVPPRISLTERAVANLDKEEQTLLAEQQLKLNAIAERKQKLQALPHLETTND